MDEKEFARKVQMLEEELLGYAQKNGYSLGEMAAAVEDLYESFLKYAVLHEVLGEEKMQKLADALEKSMLEDAVKEAEEVINNVD